MNPVQSLWRGLMDLSQCRPSRADIKRDVASRYRLSVSELEGPSKSRRVAHPRQEAMFEMYHWGYSGFQAGQALGGRDSTTCHYGASRHALRLGLATKSTKAARSGRLARLNHKQGCRKS